MSGKYPSFMASRNAPPSPNRAAAGPPPALPTDRPVTAVAGDGTTAVPAEALSQAAALRDSDYAQALQKMATLAPVDLSQFDRPPQQLEDLPPEEQKEAQKAIDALQQLTAPEPTATTTTATGSAMATTPTTPTLPELPVVEPPTAGGDITPQVCPRCLWALTDSYAAPSKEDRRDFVSQLTKRGGLYRKRYELLGNTVQVTFRDTYAAELEVVERQTRDDLLNGRIAQTNDFYGRRMIYRMVMAIETLVVGGQSIIDATDCNYAKLTAANTADATILPEAQESLETAVSSSTMLQLLFDAYRVFGRLLDNLRAEALNPDFYSGIGSDL